jgi:hypothetical protein
MKGLINIEFNDKDFQDQAVANLIHCYAATEGLNESLMKEWRLFHQEVIN